MSLHDKVNAELDRRKLQKLVDDGVITPREIAEAPVYEATPSCKCDKGLVDSGTVLRCPICHALADYLEATDE